MLVTSASASSEPLQDPLIDGSKSSVMNKQSHGAAGSTDHYQLLTSEHQHEGAISKHLLIPQTGIEKKQRLKTS